MKPSLATLQELEARVPGGIPTGDEARAEAALMDASALIRQVAKVDWLDDEGALDAASIPDEVVVICLAAAKRVFVNPDGVTQQGIDGAVVSYGSTSSIDVYLTKAEKSSIREAVGRSGLWTLGTTRTVENGPGSDTRPIASNQVTTPDDPVWA